MARAARSQLLEALQLNVGVRPTQTTGVWTVIDFAAARARALAQINTPPQYAYPGGPTDFVILDQFTIERPYGWVFFYDSKRHQETGAFEDLVAGNAPILVTKHDGAVHVTGTAHATEHYLDNYERTGHVHGADGLRPQGAADGDLPPAV